MTQLAPTIVSRESSTIVGEVGPHTVVDLLKRAADRHPACGVHLRFGEQTQGREFVPYPTLLGRAEQIAGGLRAHISHPGAAVALLLEHPKDFIPAFWGCILGGYVPCPLAPVRNDPERWAKHVAHVNTVLDRPLFVSTGALLDELPQFVAAAALDDLRAGTPQEQPRRAKPSDLAIFMLTSGSTGNSKAVELTHANLIASMTARAQRQQLTSMDLMFNWIAFDHVAALLESHMIATYAGATQLHVEPAAVLADPLSFLRLINDYRVSVAFAPNFLLAQIVGALTGADRETCDECGHSFDLSCLRRIVTGGEANVVDTGRRFLELLAPYGLARNALWPAFGMTETCAASVYSHEFPDLDEAREFATVGLPLNGLEMRVVNEQGEKCQEGQLGELQLRGPMIFRGYHNNEEATRAAFSTDGWFLSGDVGRIESGRLGLIARNKDTIIVNGVNYYGHELERKLEQLPGIESSFVAVFPTRPQGSDTEKLVVTFATRLATDDDDGLYRLLVAVRNTTIMLWGFRPAVILPLDRAAFPKTSLGKIQRALLRQRLEAGHFAGELSRVEALSAMQVGAYVPPEGPLERVLGEIFAAVLGVDLAAISATANFFDLGGTSLDILKLTRTIEQRCSFKASLPIVLQNPSVRQLALQIAAPASGGIRAYDPIVALQVTGSKTPLFCVHPGNGEIFSLVNVAKYFLNDRPFYALRAPGFNHGEAYFTTFEEMVSTYIDAILKRQPQGPYAIAGYSFGCSISFEIARELEARGHSVAFLGSIDAVPRIEKQSLGFNMATGLAWVTDLITTEQFAALNKELLPEMPSDEVCEYVLQFASPDRLAELSLDFEKFSVWARVAHAMEVILYGHANSGTVNAMTVFCGEGYSPRYLPDWSSAEKWRKELKRWDDFVRQPKYVNVPGHHFTIMGPEHVAGFQAVLRSEIDLAFSRYRQSVGGDAAQQ
jgi:acyl-CoA synthetase (AMP-forming)/AMP-acid ligase II/thioesterase domain-containing protein